MAKVPNTTNKEFKVELASVEKVIGLEVDVFFVSISKTDILTGMDASLIKQELEVNTSDEIKGELVSVGSLNEVTTGGNWPPYYDRNNRAKKDDK
jgi:hypothetical protein